MAPLGEHLVGYLSMFLQLGVLALMTVLAMLVRRSLGRAARISWGVAAFGEGAAFPEAMIAADGQLYDRRSVRRD